MVGAGVTSGRWLSEFLHPVLGCSPLLVELEFEHPMRVPVPSG